MDVPSRTMDASPAFYDAIEGDPFIEEPREEDILEKITEAATSGADVNFLCMDKQLPDWKAEFRGTGKGNSALHLACWKGLYRSSTDC